MLAENLKELTKSSSKKSVGKHLASREANQLTNLILNQEIFHYGWKEVAGYFARCFCIYKKRKLYDISKEDYILEKGIKKLNKDMDVVNWVRNLHNVEVMQSILFTEFQ